MDAESIPAPEVHTIENQGVFRDLLKDILLKAGDDERIDGLLGLLEMNGLDGRMIRRAIFMLRCELDGTLSPPQEQRTRRVCLRLIAVHAATPLSDGTVADISACLDEATYKAPAVHTSRDEGDFRDLLKDVLLKADDDERIDGLLGLLEMNGLRSKMIRRAVAMLRSELDGNLSPQQEQRTVRICLRLMAVHATTPLSDGTVADISACLDEATCYQQDRTSLEEIVDDEHALPFIFNALKTFRDPENRDDVWSLASGLIIRMGPALRVTVTVRHYPLLPGILMSLLGQKGDENMDLVAVAYREFSGIVATTPALLDRLVAAVVNKPPDVLPHHYRGFACDCLLELLTNLLDTSPVLLEHVLGYGVLSAMMQFYASPPYIYLFAHVVGPISAVLATFPEYKQAVKRIADASTEDNAVIRMGKALPPRTSVAVVYDMSEN